MMIATHALTSSPKSGGPCVRLKATNNFIFQTSSDEQRGFMKAERLYPASEHEGKQGTPSASSCNPSGIRAVISVVSSGGQWGTWRAAKRSRAVKRSTTVGEQCYSDEQRGFMKLRAALSSEQHEGKQGTPSASSCNPSDIRAVISVVSSGGQWGTWRAAKRSRAVKRSTTVGEQWYAMSSGHNPGDSFSFVRPIDSPHRHASSGTPASSGIQLRAVVPLLASTFIVSGQWLPGEQRSSAAGGTPWRAASWQRATNPH
ncbi:hypothetical protein Dimus_003634 [Dionaea muscipula]